MNFGKGSRDSLLPNRKSGGSQLYLRPRSRPKTVDRHYLFRKLQQLWGKWKRREFRKGKKRDTSDREFIENEIDALWRMSDGVMTTVPSWTITKSVIFFELHPSLC